MKLTETKLKSNNKSEDLFNYWIRLNVRSSKGFKYRFVKCRKLPTFDAWEIIGFIRIRILLCLRLKSGIGKSSLESRESCDVYDEVAACRLKWHSFKETSIIWMLFLFKDHQIQNISVEVVCFYIQFDQQKKYSMHSTFAL